MATSSTLQALNFNSGVGSPACGLHSRRFRRSSHANLDSLSIPRCSELVGCEKCFFQHNQLRNRDSLPANFRVYSLSKDSNAKLASYSARRRRSRRSKKQQIDFGSSLNEFSHGEMRDTWQLCGLPEGSVKDNVIGDDAGNKSSEESNEERLKEPEKCPEDGNSAQSKGNDPTPDLGSPQKRRPLSSLDSYFQKLDGNRNPAAAASPPASASASSSPTSTIDSEIPISQYITNETSSDANSNSNSAESNEGEGKNLSKSAKALKLLDAYFDKINPPSPPAEKTSPNLEKEAKPEPFPKDVPKTMDTPVTQNSIPQEVNSETAFFEEWLETEIGSNPASAVNALIAINIGVYLLELATPQAIPGQLITSLPALFAAKVNPLILAGDWWRLITPMFLHSGFFHLGIGSLILFSVGISFELIFGTFGFLGTYIAGGMFGNLLSFVQTEQVTVGGTGPIYALLGALVVFYIKNRKTLGTDYADGEVRKIIFLGALNIFLGNPLPIDDWTHIGATFGGFLYGLLAAPRLYMADLSLKVKDNVENKNNSPTNKNPLLPPTVAAATQQKEFKAIKILLELPDNKQQFWIFALNLAIFVVLYDIATMAANGTLPENFMDLLL